jgi:hypothetical protein
LTKRVGRLPLRIARHCAAVPPLATLVEVQLSMNPLSS